MKASALSLFVLSLLFLLATPVLANPSDPILLINGSYVVAPLDPHSIDGKPVPSIAPATYTPAEPILFAIDPDRFGIPPWVLKKITFTWDFGDGSALYKKINATSRAHVYAKPGLYTVVLIADYKSAGYKDIPPQVVASVNVGVQKESPNNDLVYSVNQQEKVLSQPTVARKLSILEQINFTTVVEFAALFCISMAVLVTVAIRRSIKK
jgi:hypothetical protein